MTQTKWPNRTNVGERLYIIGDIHGQHRLFRRVYDRIQDDLNQRPVAAHRVICLGDLVDRGDSSRDVLDDLIRLTATEPWIVLRGNHEDMLLRSLNDPGFIQDWCRYGGLETLMSFGVTVRPLLKEQDAIAINLSFTEKFGDHRRQFLSSLPFSFESGSYFFCHAGIKPSLPIAAQNSYDLMWIREEFLAWTGPFEKYIVHGHTPVESIDIKHNRINLDTGAYITGRLSCLVLEDHRGYAFDSRELEFTSIF